MYKRILVPVDGSSTSLRGLDEAIRLAKTSQASLHLVHVVNEFIIDAGYAGLVTPQLIDSMREGGKRVLADAEAVVRRHDVVFDSALEETIGGRAADCIVAQAKHWRADLIVMGTHGRHGLRRLVMGSDAELVLRFSPVPVLMVRDAAEG
jgi:nucleotide-binding universal stress UspA family protein